MQAIHGIPLIDFELMVASKYRGKVDNAKSRNISFTLTLNDFRQLLMRKRCAYTGIPLTFHKTGSPTNSDLTIERIDNLKGYERGNVIAVCAAANNIKSVFEDPTTFLTVGDAVRMFNTIGKLQNN